ncbi:MAG: prepilin-type N-terminal cleavage/methylation domain-containing protein [Pseudomonadota bacterium]
MSIERRQRGLTLVELIMFMVIIGVAVVGVLQVLSLSARNSADPLRRKQALAIAEGLMEEVRLAKFTFCDPIDPNVETATSVADCTAGLAEQAGQEIGASTIRPYDNVSDYADRIKGFGFSVPYNADANNTSFTYTTYENGVALPPIVFTATVTITLDTLGSISVAGEVLRITVIVTYGTENIVLDSYRTRYAPNAI